MTTDQTYPEPPNQSIVAWFDKTGALANIYQRDDSAADEARYVNDDPRQRWFRADVDDRADYGPMTWDDIFDEGDDGRWMDGPFLLKPEPIPAEDTSSMTHDQTTETTYLVWSAVARAWWRPNGAGYTGDLWQAGRYTEEAAVEVCSRRTWADDAAFPPEVMVPAPEVANGGVFTIDELRGVEDRMAWQVEQAGTRMAEEREVRKAEASRG